MEGAELKEARLLCAYPVHGFWLGNNVNVSHKKINLKRIPQKLKAARNK